MANIERLIEEINRREKVLREAKEKLAKIREMEKDLTEAGITVECGEDFDTQVEKLMESYSRGGQKID